ncbi:acyltransferase [Aureimonas sp. Leaf454]|uniref:acyltransferase family protein n=1 Tax=Aureimonas sp. Leaf454 TaxID=1736381 RepID=UPI0006F3DFEC|nr:acyltransferase [Aureimonas sp. Leaf454]KQT43110.1 acyltransferase [Aureimonas sp. Leaf454]
MERTDRLHYVDALRVGAFGLLILYHASVAFFPHMTWLVHAAETSAGLEAVMDHPRAWRLALLFFVSGMGTCFAARGRPLPAFLRERAVRLGVPLLVAMGLVVVPQVWMERVIEEGYDGSLLRFWLTRYFVEGRYPTGQITWAHMWFVAYLLAILAIGLPILRMIAEGRGRAVSTAFERLARGPCLPLLFLLPLALNLVLTPFFPRETNALYNDGAWAATWGAWFGLGYLFARHHATLIGGIVARRRRHAALAFGITVVLASTSGHEGGHAGGPLSIGSYEAMTPAFKCLTFALAWSMILTLVGVAAHHVRRLPRPVAWLNEGVFAFYIVHQTIVVAALFWLLPLDLGLWTTYALVTAATVAGCCLFFALARRLPGPLPMAFGIRRSAPPIPRPIRPLETPVCEPAEAPRRAA